MKVTHRYQQQSWAVILLEPHMARCCYSNMINNISLLLVMTTTVHSVQLPSQWHHCHRRPIHSIESIVSIVVHVTAKCLNVAIKQRSLGGGYNYNLTSIGLRFNCNSSALQLFDMSHITSCSLNEQIGQRACSLRVSGPRCVNVHLMTFNRQSDARRIEVESWL